MNFHIITLFPDSFGSYLGESILKRAIEDKKIKVKFYNPRDFGEKKNGLEARIDKKPYGGGPGMVIQALPVIKAIEKAIGNKTLRTKKKIKIIFLNPGGTQFDTNYAKDVIKKKYTDIVIISGRYEGIDARVKKVFKSQDISVGPFVLTGGELPAMIMIDCIARQVKGVLGDFNSLEESRISSRDVYTRPEIFEYKKKKYRVPKILLSGHHAKIDEWKGDK
ncbi:MAG: tRNA (guanosine(37)-N1)-methyltransferase TrmD [bacterium]|nr:tRNA (guanosine(37)-N1)-methyltransferase TrmD [bacterium]